MNIEQTSTDPQPHVNIASGWNSTATWDLCKWATLVGTVAVASATAGGYMGAYTYRLFFG